MASGERPSRPSATTWPRWRTKPGRRGSPPAAGVEKRGRPGGRSTPRGWTPAARGCRATPSPPARLRTTCRSRPAVARVVVASVLPYRPIVDLLDTFYPEHERCVQLVERTREALVVPGLVLVELDDGRRKLYIPELRQLSWRSRAGAYRHYHHDETRARTSRLAEAARTRCSTSCSSSRRRGDPRGGRRYESGDTRPARSHRRETEHTQSPSCRHRAGHDPPRRRRRRRNVHRRPAHAPRRRPGGAGQGADDERPGRRRRARDPRGGRTRPSRSRCRPRRPARHDDRDEHGARGQGRARRPPGEKGFRYVLEIARWWTPAPISGWIVWDKPQPLVDVRDVREVRGRATARGEVAEAVDADELRAAVQDLERRGVEALTVSLLNGYARPALEQDAAAVARDAVSGLPVSVSSSVLPEFREYERLSSTIVNAYLMPIAREYLSRFEAEVGRLGAPAAAVHHEFGRRHHDCGAGRGAPDRHALLGTERRRERRAARGAARGLSQHHHLRHGRHQHRRLPRAGRQAAALPRARHQRRAAQGGGARRAHRGRRRQQHRGDRCRRDAARRARRARARCPDRRATASAASRRR